MPNREKKNEGESKLTKEEAIELAEMLRFLLDAYGFFAERLGNIQKAHKEAFESMFSLKSAMEIPEMLGEMAEKAPELNELFTRIFIRMASFLPQINNLMNLSATDKIKLGKNLKLIAKDFDEVLEWIEKVKEE